MSVITLEGRVRDGEIVVDNGVELPESANVLVIIPDEDSWKRVMTPRDVTFLEKLQRRIKINEYQL